MTRPAPANAHFGPSQPEADAANLPNESLVASICFTTLYVFLNKRIRREYEPQCDVPGELPPIRTLLTGKVRLGHHPPALNDSVSPALDQKLGDCLTLGHPKLK